MGGLVSLLDYISLALVFFPLHVSNSCDGFGFHSQDRILSVSVARLLSSLFADKVRWDLRVDCKAF
jgi:hypothetical protein